MNNIVPLFPSEPIPDTPNGPLYQAWKRMRDDEIAKEVLTARHLPPLKTMEQVKQEHIDHALKVFGSVKSAAIALGINPATIFWRRKRKPVARSRYVARPQS
jgi:hypothetical protein